MLGLQKIAEEQNEENEMLFLQAQKISSDMLLGKRSTESQQARPCSREITPHASTVTKPRPLFLPSVLRLNVVLGNNGAFVQY